MPSTEIADLLQRHSRAASERVAFVEGSSGRTRTWSEVWAQARAWQDIEALAGRRVGLCIADPLEMATCYLGALASGVCAAPLDPRATPTELNAQCARLGLTAIVTDQPLDGAPGGGAQQAALWTVRSGALTLVAPGRGGPQTTGDGAALILSSSGTTGTPKIVPLATSHLLQTARSVVDAHQLGASDCGYSPLPLFHINGLVVGILSTVLTGGRLVVDRRFSAHTFWEVVEANRATWLNLVPGIITVLGQVAPPEPGQAGTVRFARSASAPLPLSALLRFEEHCALPVIETYGMTEAASQITANPLVAPRAGSVGCPVGIELRVVGRDRAPLATGAVGEVEIRGPTVIGRYWSPVGTEPKSRVATHADGWLATGDLGSLDDDGYLYLLGRIDDVINRGGEKVHPREVEEVLLQDHAVSAAVVVGRPHPIVGEEPVAVVVMHPGHTDEARLTARLHQRCERELSRYKRPVAITVAAQLPAGATGKVNRREVRRASVPL